MNKDELGKVEKRINRLINRGYFKNKTIFLFGASDHTRQVIQILREKGIEPFFVLDNDKRKKHSFCAGLEVITVEDVTNLLDENHVYVIYSLFWREMKEQLLHLGVRSNNIVCLYEKNKMLLGRFLESYKGKKIYRRIRNQYGKLQILLCPYTGTGDVYLIGTFLNQYIQKQKLEDYVLIVVSNACKKVADIFKIKNVEILKNQKEGEYLIKYYLLCPDKISLKVLNDSWQKIHTNKLEWFRGYKNWYFMELFRTFVFDLPDEALPEKPLLDNMDEEVDSIFNDNNLIAGKTVIISPYANTLADLPASFWEDIVKYLKNKEYIVCTNSSNISEPAIPGTIPISFSLTIAPQFVSKAGAFIGIRSGLCDVISASNAKKIILYDEDNKFYNCSAFQYFSLNHMGLCDDAIEIEFNNKELFACAEKIMNYF